MSNVRFENICSSCRTSPLNSRPVDHQNKSDLCCENRKISKWKDSVVMVFYFYFGFCAVMVSSFYLAGCQHRWQLFQRRARIQQSYIRDLPVVIGTGTIALKKLQNVFSHEIISLDIILLEYFQQYFWQVWTFESFTLRSTRSSSYWELGGNKSKHFHFGIPDLYILLVNFLAQTWLKAYDDLTPFNLFGQIYNKFLFMTKNISFVFCISDYQIELNRNGSRRKQIFALWEIGRENLERRLNQKNYRRKSGKRKSVLQKNAQYQTMLIKNRTEISCIVFILSCNVHWVQSGTTSLANKSSC